VELVHHPNSLELKNIVMGNRLKKYVTSFK